jgi:hypothetical protein
MSNQTFLVEYEIKSHGIITSTHDSLAFHHPEQNVSIEIKNKQAEPGQYDAILSAYIILEADSFNTAEILSLDFLKEFIDMLTFSTNMHFSIGDMLKVVDWSPGIEERRCLIINKFPGDERPYPVIDESLIKTIELLLSGNISSRLHRALRWFSNGVSARYLDEQFQCFWFVVEILSQEVKPTEKVNDACPFCKEALYCPKCKTNPTHKPYPKQAIEHLFSLVVKGDDGKAFEILNKFRNALMHGDSVEKVERKIGIKLSTQIDVLGKIAWYSILNILKNSLPATGQKIKLHLIETNTYCEHEMHIKMDVTFKSKNPEDPCITDLPEFNVEMIHEQK